MQARGETAQPFSVDVFVNGEAGGPPRVHRGGDDRAGSDRRSRRRPTRAPTRCASSSATAARSYWSAAAVYYDTADRRRARSGSRQLAITRKYALLTPVTVKDRIVYRETPFTGTAKPGDVLTVRLTVAGSPEWRYLALEDPLPAGVEAIQDTTAYPLEREAPESWWCGSRVEYRDSRTVFFQETFERGRYEFAYLVKVIAPGQFRAVPAQISPMYVPGVHASSEPQAFTIAGEPWPGSGARDEARAGDAVDPGRQRAHRRRLLGVPEHAGVHDLGAGRCRPLLALIGAGARWASPSAARSRAGRTARR